MSPADKKAAHTSDFEYKVINKQLMATRYKGSAWRIEANIFEVVKAFLLWKHPNDWLPFYAPHIDERKFPNLLEWYDLLSEPNSPYKRMLKVSENEYLQWLLGLDLSKPPDRDSCHRMFEIIATSAPKREMDAVEIVENENRGE